MTFDKVSPCKTCPYRMDAPLAHWDRAEFRRLLELDQDQLGKVYGCHKADGSVCRGFLIDQRERDYPCISLRMMIFSERVPGSYLESLTCSAPMYDSIESMVYANFPTLLLEIESPRGQSPNEPDE